MKNKYPSPDPYLSDLLMIVVMLACLILTILHLASCATIPTSAPLEKTEIYKYDIKGDVNGHPFDGVGVVPFASHYSMRIVSRTDVNMLTVTTCHRDKQFENAIQLGWFDNGRGYTYDLQPDEFENHGQCLVKFGAYNKSSQGQNAWGIVDFESPDFTMSAYNVCNGETTEAHGVSICQSKAGLLQGIRFEVPVRIAQVAQHCEITTKDNMFWEYQLARGECVWAFRELNGIRLHRLTSVGYTAIQIRGK